MDTVMRSRSKRGSLRLMGIENCFLQPLRTLRTSGWLVTPDMLAQMGENADAIPER